MRYICLYLVSRRWVEQMNFLILATRETILPRGIVANDVNGALVRMERPHRLQHPRSLICAAVFSCVGEIAQSGGNVADKIMLVGRSPFSLTR